MRLWTALGTCTAIGLTGLLLGGAEMSSGSRTAAAQQFYVKESWHAFSGDPSKGKPTDIYAFQSTLTTMDGSPAGSVNGFATNLRPPYVAWTMTATTREGSLTMSAAISLHADRQVFVVSGGTGRYVGAHGTLTLSDAGDKGQLAVLALTA